MLDVRKHLKSKYPDKSEEEIEWGVAVWTDAQNQISDILDKANLKKEELIARKKKEFATKLSAYVPTYGKDMLNDFWRYWTEANKSKTKVKWELQETFEVEGRLRTWADKSAGFKNKAKAEAAAPPTDRYTR